MNILLVEDSKSIRESLSEFLLNLGHRVAACNQGKKALVLLGKQDMDLVLSDIQMPVMDGHELLKQIRASEKWKNTEVVLFTGYGHVKSAVEAMRNGAYDYLLKPVDVKELDLILKRISDYHALRKENQNLTHRLRSVTRKTQIIENELLAVQQAFAREFGTAEYAVSSESMRGVFQTAEKLHARPDIPVLLEGETGTGKELVAHFIHYGRGDAVTPFVGLNCAAISSTLFESELFGYEAGSFTGGHPKGQKGKLELAANGSLFLDEITEMPNEHQAKLLRVIQEREYFRVGGIHKTKTAARFICATNQDISKMVQNGSFRQDLYFRLNIGYLRIPPLRERPDDIVPLAQFFLGQLAQKKKTRFRKIHSDAVRILMGHPWPGNVRELKNTIERIVLYWDEESVLPNHVDACLQKIPAPGKPEGKPELDFPGDGILPDDGMDLKQWNLEIVRRAMEKHQGNQTRTARFLGISVRELHTYLKQLNR